MKTAEDVKAFIEYRDSYYKELRGGVVMIFVKKHYKWLTESELLQHWIDHVYHPTLPSDEVEFALKLNKYIHDQCIDGTPHDIGWNVMKMFSTRIAEMERELKDTKRLLQQHIDFRAECTALNDPAITEIDEKHFPF